MKKENDDLRAVGPRVILNANLGVTNIIERDVIRRDMGKVTDSIFDKLKAHYGPYSSFAGLDANRPLEDTVFTKDGANIIHAIQYSSLLEDWVRRAVEYIGKNIETAAGDGTTSSMMFTCGMLKFMSQTIDKMKPLNYNKLYEAWNDLVKDIQRKMKPYIMRPVDVKGKYDKDMIYKLAFAQAYTSSHGNIELSEAVATIFKNTPPNMWKQMTFKRRHYEATKLFEVHSSAHQYEMRTEIFSKTVYNKDAGRYLEYNNATLVVVNSKIEIDTKYWKEIRDLIENSTEEHPVAILCWNDFDNATFGTLMDMLTKKEDDGRKKYCFAVFGSMPAHPKINDFTTIQSISGADIIQYSSGDFDGRPFVLKDVYVKYEFEMLELDNLYPDPNRDEESIKERPYYNDSTHPYLRTWADTIAKYIDAYESGDLSHNQQRELKTFRECYNKLVYDKELYIVIGGKTFDNLAMFDVVNDVIKATIRSMDCGMVISNNKTLYLCVSDLLEKFDDEALAPSEIKDKVNHRLKRWLAGCIKDTLGMFSDVVLEQLYPYGKKTLKSTQNNYIRQSWIGRLMPSFGLFNEHAGLCSEQVLLEDSMSTMFLELSSKFNEDERKDFRAWWFRNTVDMISYDNSMLWGDEQSKDCAVPIITIAANKKNAIPKMIVQPANADIVMLERFGELAIKFILTERVIVDGTAYLNKEKKK